MISLENMGETPESIEYHLTTLQEMQGWKILIAWMKDGISSVERKIFDTENMSKEEFDRLKDKRRVMMDMMNAPKTLTALYTKPQMNSERDVYE